MTAIPVMPLRAIEHAQLISIAFGYRPARATELQFILEGLSKQQRDIVLKLSEDIKFLDSDRFKTEPETAKDYCRSRL